MRKVWKLEVEWDQKIPKEITTEMKSICKDLKCQSYLLHSRPGMNKTSMDFMYFATAQLKLMVL